jgi:hypothetical protein
MNNMSPEFTSHQLNDLGLARCQNISVAFDTLLKVIEAAVPESRQLSIVITKLEEACFYARKGVSLRQEYQVNAKQ